MNASILVEGFNWVLEHYPDVAAILFVVYIVVWTAIKLNNFGHRVSATERLCNDIHTRQLPELRAEMNDRFGKIDDRFLKIEERLSKMELSLNTIITYLSIK